MSIMDATRPTSAPNDKPCKYWAFISYSHQDKIWADWLHKALETYRVPRAMVGRKTLTGQIPARLFPVFRDQDELPTSGDLGQAIRDALQQSRCLIVICSPRAAGSRWVNEEVRAFKRLPQGARLFCLIVGGEPNAADKPQLGQEECFPEAIRFALDEEGKPTAQRIEPIAADVRPGQSGRRDALLKIVAGMLGVGFDELRQRDLQRRRRRLAMLAGVIAVSLSLSLWSALHAMELERKLLSMPFSHMSNRYTPMEIKELEDVAAFLKSAYKLADDSVTVGRSSADELASVSYSWRMCEAELAWARGDMPRTLEKLESAVAEANRYAEMCLLRVKNGLGYFHTLTAAMKLRLDAAVALGRMRQLLGVKADNVVTNTAGGTK